MRATYKQSRVTAVIVAAGRSKRMGRLGDKIWIPLAGRPVLFYSLRAFFDAGIRDIVIVARAGDEVRVLRYARRACSGRASVCVVTGGAERQDSVWNGLEATDAQWVLVHDAARAGVTAAVIRAVMRGARKSGACVPALPVADTLKRVRRGRVVRTEDRAELYGVQTPQGFRRDLLMRAIAAARRKGVTGTDCASMVEALGTRVAVSAGNPRNLKLTTPEDMDLLRAIIR